jgi:hypothetical protein
MEGTNTVPSPTGKGCGSDEDIADNRYRAITAACDNGSAARKSRISLIGNGDLPAERIAAAAGWDRLTVRIAARTPISIGQDRDIPEYRDRRGLRQRAVSPEKSGAAAAHSAIASRAANPGHEWFTKRDSNIRVKVGPAISAKPGAIGDSKAAEVNRPGYRIGTGKAAKAIAAVLAFPAKTRRKSIEPAAYNDRTAARRARQSASAEPCSASAAKILPAETLRLKANRLEKFNRSQPVDADDRLTCIAGRAGCWIVGTTPARIGGHDGQSIGLDGPTPVGHTDQSLSAKGIGNGG